MEIQITAIKFEMVNGKKTGKSFSFKMDPKKMAEYKTEATLRKKIDEYVAMSGVFTKEDLKEFCDQVFDAVEEGECFSAKSLREAGFYNDLYELGFSDWFYGGVLASDPRFSFGRVFSSIILCKDSKEITKKSFLVERIRTHRSIDAYDLMSELEGIYGCEITDKFKLTYTIQGTDIFYDEILDRFYANEELYYREIDEAGGYA